VTDAELEAEAVATLKGIRTSPQEESWYIAGYIARAAADEAELAEAVRLLKLARNKDLPVITLTHSGLGGYDLAPEIDAFLARHREAEHG
jgi:hypothetical protein